MRPSVTLMHEISSLCNLNDAPAPGGDDGLFGKRDHDVFANIPLLRKGLGL